MAVRLWLRHTLSCFNPLPSPKQGEMHDLVATVRVGSRFQSAPLTEARGDRVTRPLIACYFLFQSAPLTEARGDL